MTDDMAIQARHWTRQAVLRMTGDLGDPRSAVYDPLAALTALTALGAARTGAERDHARAAREQGRSWDEIAARMGITRGTAPAAEAFARVASELGDGPAVAWRCPKCGRMVLDYGPEAGGPADQERGHAEGCARLAGTVRAYEGAGEGNGDA